MAEVSKGAVEHQTRRLGAVALVPTIGLADKDAEAGRAVAVIYAVHSGVADRPQGLSLVDRKRRVVLRLRPPVVPVLLASPISGCDLLLWLTADG